MIMPRGVYPRKSKPIEQRFWEKVVVVENGCWKWLGSDNGDGYGLLTVRRRTENYQKNIYAHRLSWEIHKGPVPDGLFVLHKCDNPPCTNPEHLFLGTNKDNMEDCVAKGRQNGAAKAHPGEKNGNAVLTWDIVRYIRSSTDSGAELGRRFNVSKSLISGIRRGRAWKK